MLCPPFRANQLSCEVRLLSVVLWSVARARARRSRRLMNVWDTSSRTLRVDDGRRTLETSTTKTRGKGGGGSGHQKRNDGRSESEKRVYCVFHCVRFAFAVVVVVSSGRVRTQTHKHTIHTEDVSYTSVSLGLNLTALIVDVLGEHTRVFVELAGTIEKWASNGLLFQPHNASSLTMMCTMFSQVLHDTDDTMAQ